MRIHHLLVAATLVATAAQAEPAGRPGPPPPHSGGPGHPHGPPVPSGAPSGRHGPFGPHDGDHDHDGPRGGGPEGRHEGPEGKHEGPDGKHEGGSPEERWHHWDADLHAGFRDRHLKPEAVKQKIEEWRAARGERRREHVEAIRAHWGQALGRPEVVAELKRHALRMATLGRIEELAATERTGDARTRVLDRVEKLRTRENERHERAMQKLAAGGAAPGPSGSAAPTPAPSAAPAASGGTP
jgi:hypothetical protein